MSMAPSRVLVTGAGGLLGTPTLAAFSRFATAVGHDLELDITDRSKLDSRFREFEPDLVVNCAAFTRVDDCESEEDEARRINADGAGNVAASAASVGARFIHFSTDYVFGGRATSPIAEDQPTGVPDSLSAYGRTKLLGEQRVFQAHPRALVVRTAWMFGPDGGCFPATMIKLACEGRPLKVVNDQVGSPTYAPDLAEAIVALSGTNAEGVVHVTNSGSCTWYEFACRAIEAAGLNVVIEPVTTAAFPRPARRPAYSVLDCGRFEGLTGKPMRPWHEALQSFVERLH